MCKLYIFVNSSSTHSCFPSAFWRFWGIPVICQSPEVGLTKGSESKLWVALESCHLTGNGTLEHQVLASLWAVWKLILSSFLYWIPFEICGTWVYVDWVTEQEFLQGLFERGHIWGERWESPSLLDAWQAEEQAGTLRGVGSRGSTSDCITMYDYMLAGTLSCVFSPVQMAY